MHRAETTLLNLSREFDTIECQKTLNLKTIRSAFRRKALKVHPDKQGGSEAEFKKVNAAAEKITTHIRDLLTRYPELDSTDTTTAQQ